MTKSIEISLRQLLASVLGAERGAALLRAVEVPAALEQLNGERVSRSVLAQALNLVLFDDLLSRVPTGRRYVMECVSKGLPITFDHGALRTVALHGMGNLPAGESVISRVLHPLGYRANGLYPLDRLGMTGRSYTHEDYPQDLPQFFVSELHPERFSTAFQAAVHRVTSTSRDPLGSRDLQLLMELGSKGELSFADASALLPQLARCFQRQHSAPRWSDYELLLAESAEMAWIATEGNAFNHATDRVASIAALVAEQRRLGRPLKDSVEVSRSGRVHQTAFRADSVDREFIDNRGAIIHRTVPGSFYEFIQRDPLPADPAQRLDLSFDTSNAQGIFKMTAAA